MSARLQPDGHVEGGPAYRHNGRPVDADTFYRIACDPQRPVAVEACAGAGKTWMLVSRILRALLAGAPPHEILAISFTRKAAGEMRERLMQWLAEFARAEPARLVGELRLRGLDEREAVAAAEPLKGLYAQVLATGRPVQIRTFHSWFWTLVGAAPISLLDRLGLPANAELVEDDAGIAAQLWRRLSAALIARPEARADYDALVFTHGRVQVQKALQAALARRVEFALADELGVPERSVEAPQLRFAEFAGLKAPADLLLAPGSRATLLAAARALAAHASAKTVVAKGVELEQALGRDDAAGIESVLLTQAGEPRKFSDKLAGIERVRAAQDLALRVAAARCQHDAHEYQQRMTRLVRLMVREFAQLKRERGMVDMGDIELAAARMLADPLLGGFVLQRLDARVRHLLIDEFQDTNPLQWQALYGWLSGYAGAGGGARQGPSVFIVGDPKQSIYRFRRAEPQVFRAAQAFVRHGLGGDLLACDHTRRCAGELLGMVNRVMLAAQADGHYEDFRAHTTGSTQPGAALELRPIARDRVARPPAAPDGAPRWRDSLTEPRTLPEETLARLEASQAADWLAAQLAQGLAARDVLVLSRRRAPLVALEGELRRRRIAATDPDKTALGAAAEVQDIVALLDALVSPAHDLSLARALRSPLFALPDDALVQIALARRQAGDHPPAWFDLLQQQELYRHAALAPHVELRRKLTRWKDWVDALSPHDALAAIYHDGDVLARFAAAVPAPLRETVLANLRALLSAALEMDGARFTTPYALVRWLKSRHGPKAPASSAPDAVQLLTVHGAKGLEAPLVLLLDAQGRARSAETMGLLIDWPGEAAAPRRLVFMASEARPGACCVELLAAEQAAREREELNALYVAMTRARERFVVSSVEPSRAAPSVGWRTRLSPHCDPVEALPDAWPESPPPLPAAAPPAAFSMPDLPPAPMPCPRPAVETGATGPALRFDTPPDDRVGAALRRLLALARLGARGIPDGQVQAVAREFALNAEQADRMARTAARVLGGAAAWAWDPDAIDWSGSGIGLVHNGATLQIDRLVRRRDSGHWWVLDCSFALAAEQQAAEVERMRGGRAALQAVRADAVVRLARVTAEGALLEIE